MLLKIIPWVVVLLLGFLWWKRRAANKRNRDRGRK